MDKQEKGTIKAPTSSQWQIMFGGFRRAGVVSPSTYLWRQPLSPSLAQEVSQPPIPAATFSETLPIDVVKQFHRAQTPKEKQELILPFDSRSRDLGIYYSTHAYEPQEIERSARKGFSYVDRYRWHLMKGLYPTDQEFRAMVDISTKPNLDWHAFTGMGEVCWEEFFTLSRDTRVIMRFSIRPDDFYKPNTTSKNMCVIG